MSWIHNDVSKPCKSFQGPKTNEGILERDSFSWKKNLNIKGKARKNLLHHLSPPSPLFPSFAPRLKTTGYLHHGIYRNQFLKATWDNFKYDFSMKCSLFFLMTTLDLSKMHKTLITDKREKTSIICNLPGRLQTHWKEFSNWHLHGQVRPNSINISIVRVFSCTSIIAKCFLAFFFFKTESLNLSTMGTWSRYFFVGGCAVHCRMFCNISGLYSLDTGSTSPLAVTTANNSRHCQCPLEGKITPTETTAVKFFCHILVFTMPQPPPPFNQHPRQRRKKKLLPSSSLGSSTYSTPPQPAGRGRRRQPDLGARSLLQILLGP